MTEIYVQLLDEGSVAYRPTTGVSMGNGVFRVLPTANYEIADEVWEFPPGSLVVCNKETKEGEDILVARQLAETPTLAQAAHR